MKKVAVFAAKVVAWVVIMVIGCVGAYAAIMDLVYYHPAWQWLVLETSFVVLALALALFMFGRKVSGYGLISAWLIIECVLFSSVWTSGAILNNTMAVICGLMGVAYACIAYNDRNS